jgi:HlyD family secretion protein
MRFPLCLAICTGAAIFAGTATIRAADPKPAPADTKAPAASAAAEKKAPEPGLADAPATYKVKRELFKIELSLKGVFEAEKATEVILRPEVWAGMEVEKAVDHGQTVKRGDVLLQCDLDKIDEELADQRAKAAITELSIKQAEEALRSLEVSTPMDLKLAIIAQQHVQEDLDRFLKIDRPMSEKLANFMVKSSENYLEYEREELQQLEKMYKADELTEETEKIVLKRQRNAVESSEMMLERARADRDEILKVELPRRQETYQQARERQDLVTARAKVTLPVALEQQRRELAKLKLDRAKDEQKLKKLAADRESLIVRAPTDGVVYYGRFVRGKWSGVETVADSLRRGGAIGKNTVIMTIVAPRPLFVRATVSEADLDKTRSGMKGIVRPTAYPELRLDATLSRVDPIPTASESFDARIDVNLGGGDKRTEAIVPGMACTAKFMTYVDRKAIVLPAKSVFDEDLDEDRHFVFLARKGAEPEKRFVTIGKRTDDKVEIARGLAEGDEVLQERPKDKPPAAEKPKEPEKKPAETPKPKESPKKKPAPETTKKPATDKKDPAKQPAKQGAKK